MIKEFVDARRQNTAMQLAPQVLYSSRDPPLEIRNVPGLIKSDDVGYVTFGRSIRTKCVLFLTLHFSTLSPAFFFP